MNLLCPDCHSSVSFDESEPILCCPSCGLTANLSRIETAPGVSSLPMVRDLSGETLGEYELTELIGVGGMGVVYKGRVKNGTGEDVAVKVLNCDYHWQREEFVARFRREARALAKLDHPNIVTILDSGRDGDLYYLVTEYVEGVNLAQHLRGRELSVSEIVSIMTQACAALTYAHENGVVHRDVKPANIVIAEGTVKVLDFGLAQITGGDSNLSSLTRTDLAMGTINYLSPEQRTSAKQVDERSDVFSLGVVLYEMLTGTLPLGGFAPASRARPGIGRRGDQVVHRSLDADPARRFQSVSELAAALGQLTERRATGRRAALAA
ncbi:MAG: serine/threonine-protein kinase, partial [bacterium]